MLSEKGHNAGMGFLDTRGYRKEEQTNCSTYALSQPSSPMASRLQFENAFSEAANEVPLHPDIEQHGRSRRHQVTRRLDARA